MNHIEKIFAADPSPEAFTKGYLSYLQSILDKLNVSQIAEMIKIFLKARDRENTIFFVGNGGSASTASHFANDLSIGTTSLNPPFRAVSLCDNISIITAIGNDFGYDQVFVKQLDKLMKPGDILVAISASGNSPNVINAVTYANKNGGVSIGLTGFDGGRLYSEAKHVVHVPSEKGEYGPVEDVHMVFDHLVGSFLKALCLGEGK